MLESEKRDILGEIEPSATEQRDLGIGMMNLIQGKGEQRNSLKAEGRRHLPLAVKYYGPMEGFVYVPLPVNKEGGNEDNDTQIKLGKIPFHIYEGRLFTVGQETTAMAIGTPEFPQKK